MASWVGERMYFGVAILAGVTAVYLGIAVGAVRAGVRRANQQWRRAPHRR